MSRESGKANCIACSTNSKFEFGEFNLEFSIFPIESCVFIGLVWNSYSTSLNKNKKVAFIYCFKKPKFFFYLSIKFFISKFHENNRNKYVTIVFFLNCLILNLVCLFVFLPVNCLKVYISY